MQHSGGRLSAGGENKCCLCSTKFNAVNRKRHCKVCGDTFCGSCSNYRVAVPRFGYNKPVRVCANCHMRFLLIRNEIDFTFLFEKEEKGRRGSESLESSLSPRGSLSSGGGSPFATPRRSVDGNADEDEDKDAADQQTAKQPRGSVDEGSPGLFKRGGSKRLLRAVTKKSGSQRESTTNNGTDQSSPAIEFDLRERDVREAVRKLQLPVFFIDRRTIEVVQRKTVVFNAGAPILISGRRSSKDGLHLKLAEVNIAFWIIGGEMQTTNHKRASMRKQRVGKGNMKYAVILDGHPIADDRGPDRTELSVVFKNMHLFDWLSFSRTMRELITLTTIHRAEGSPQSKHFLSNEMAPYFVQLLGVCVTDGSNGLQMGFVFEPMTKGSLRNCFIQCREELNQPEIEFSIARHIACAMTHLHDKFGYIHANLSPENVLVAEDWSVKIGGFGNALRPEGIPYAARSSPSPRFHLAPEVLKRDEYSFASDVYSYGMVLVELITLQPPFKQDQFKQLRQITSHPELGEAIESYGLLPAFDQTTEIGALICQCLSADPKERPRFADIVKRLDEMKDSCIAEMRYNMRKRDSRLPKPEPKKDRLLPPQPTLHVRINEADNTVKEIIDEEGQDDRQDDREEVEVSTPTNHEKEEEIEREKEKEKEKLKREDESRAKAKAKEEEEREERERKEREEEAEREMVREKIRRMMPTRDQGKLDTMAKVEQLKGRLGSASATSSSPGSVSTETTAEERQRRQREERARRVRELAEQRRGKLTSSPSSSSQPSPAYERGGEEEKENERRAKNEREERERKDREDSEFILAMMKQKEEEDEEEEERGKEGEEEEKVDSEEERKRREKEERVLRVKQIEERMKKRPSPSSPLSPSPSPLPSSSGNSPPASSPSSLRTSVREIAKAKDVRKNEAVTLNSLSDHGEEKPVRGERSRGLSITEAERQARKNLVQAGREHLLQHLENENGDDGDVGLDIVDEVTRMIGELAEHDEDIRRLRLV